MPLVRYEIRNEYSLANPDLYRTASKDDPQGMLEGVCMAGLVGIVRQLGDLAEFAAEVFHDLHEELMTTAARGHGLMIRVQQLEAEFPLIEKDLLTRNDQLRFAYTPGVDWHASIRTEQNHLTQGDLPRFILNSYEECRGPPRLFLLDKFDVAGAGACLKRYTDPSFFKMEWASSELMKAEKIQKEKKARKKKGRRRRNGEAAEVAPANARVRYSSLDLDQPMYKQKIYVNTGPQKLKLKQSYSLLYLNEEDGNSSLQVPYETFGSPKPIETGPLGSLSLSNAMNVKSDSDSSLRFPSEKQVTAGRQTKVSFDSSCHEHTRNDTYDQKKTELATPKEFYKDDTTDNLSNVSDADLYKASSYVSVHQKTTWSQQDVSDGNIAMDGKKEAEIAGSKFENDDAASEADNYMDALATIESEIDTDSEGRTKHEDHNTLNHETSVVSSKMSSMHSRFIDAEAGSFYNGESSDESSKVDHFSKKYLDDPSSIEFAAYDVPLKRYSPDTSLEQSPGSVLIPIESSSDKSTDALNVESSEQKNIGPIDLADIRNVTSTFNKNHIPSITRGPSTAEEFEDVTKEIQMPAEVPANKETLNTNEILAGHGADIKSTAADEPVIVSKALQEDVGIKEPQTTMSKLDESSFGRAAPDELRSILLDIHASETTTHDNMGIADSSLVCRESPANISSPTTDRELSVESAVVKEDVCAIKHEQDFEYERPGSGEGLEASQTILNIDTHLDASISAHDDEHISVSQKTNVEGLKMEESVSRLQDSDLDQSLESPTLDMADSYQNKGITSVEDENIWKAEDIPIKDLHVQSEQIVTSGDSVDDVFEKRVSEESTIARPGNVIDVEVPAPAEDSHSIKPSLSSGSFKSIFDIRPRAEHIGTSSEVFSTSSSNLTSERGSKNSNELDTQLLSVIRPVKPAGADLPEEPVVDVPAKEEVEGEPPSPTIEFIKITFQSGPESPLSLSSTSSENLQEQHHQIDQQIRSCPPLQEEGRSTAINEDFEHRSIDEFGITSRQFSHRLSDSSEEIAVYSGRIVLSDEEDTGSPGASSTSSLSSLGSPRAKDHSFLNLKCSSPETKPSRSPSQSPNISLGSSPRSLRSSRPHSPVPQKEPHQSSTRSSATIIPEISASEQSTDTDAKMLPTPPPLPPADWGKSSIHHGTSLPGSVQVHPPVPPPPPPPQLNFDNGRLNISTSDLASKMQKNAPQRNDSLIEEITSHDKSTLKKVSNQAPNTSKSQDNREVLLEQIRSQSFNLRRTPVTKPTISRPVTNINVAAILEKANAIRQAYEGSDEEGEDDDWSDT